MNNSFEQQRADDGFSNDLSTFNRWLQSPEGRACTAYPVKDIALLENRLFMAFMAGVQHGENKIKLQ